MSQRRDIQGKAGSPLETLTAVLVANGPVNLGKSFHFLGLGV